MGAGQIQLTRETQNSIHGSSSAPGEVLSYVYGRVIQHETAIAAIGTQVAMTQEELTASGKIRKQVVEDDDEENNKAGAGACFVM